MRPQPPRTWGFEERVRFYGWTVTRNGCWEFLGPRNAKGYGRLRFQGKKVLVHRKMYELFSGREIPEYLITLHSCDNPPCINPDHLRPGTHRENTLEAELRGRSRHPLGAENGKSVLNRVSALSMIEDFSTGSFTRRELSAKYGVSTSTVDNVLAQRHWSLVQYS